MTIRSGDGETWETETSGGNCAKIAMAMRVAALRHMGLNEEEIAEFSDPVAYPLNIEDEIDNFVASVQVTKLNELRAMWGLKERK